LGVVVVAAFDQALLGCRWQTFAACLLTSVITRHHEETSGKGSLVSVLGKG
jgi:hypothetical protein